MSVTNKILVVGASSDIGQAVTKRLLDDGYQVLGTYCTRNDNLIALKEKHIKYANSLNIIKLDIKCVDQIRSLFLQKNILQGLKGLVFLPAVENKLPLLELTPEILLNTFQINFFSAVFLYQYFSKFIIESNSAGSIVGISSEITRFGGHHQFPYVASKSSLNALTMVSAKEWGPYKIRVNAVSPGKISAGKNFRHSQDNIPIVPLGRLGSSDEVANAVAWLLSDQSLYITGAVIPVNGGR